MAKYYNNPLLIGITLKLPFRYWPTPAKMRTLTPITPTPRDKPATPHGR